MCNSAQKGITLVFDKPSGRLFSSANRAAIPKGRDDEGAVKRYLDWAVLGSRAGMFRVLFFSFRTLLTVCLFASHAALSSAAQSAADDNKPKDEPKRIGSVSR